MHLNTSDCDFEERANNLIGIDGKIAQSNGRLKAGHIGLRIERHGKKLLLRGILPPRPNSQQEKPYQQRISLQIPATATGLKMAEAEARSISARLILNTFNWRDYLQTPTVKPQTCQDWISQAKNIFFSKGGTETTWTGDYWKIYKLLPPDEPLTLSLLLQVVQATAPNTRTRKRASMAAQYLAAVAGIPFDGAALAGKYGPRQVDPRQLPGDDLILECFYKIQNPSWRWVFGMLATYGLRNHEVFKLDFDKLKDGVSVVQILANTKTGQRKTWPFHPEWFEEFNLKSVLLPAVNLDRSNERIGRSVSDFFREAGIPFTPYDLRHRWAVRTLEYGLSYELAAIQQGHSAAVHKRTYHRWITDDVHNSVNQILIARIDRPVPPTYSRQGAGNSSSPAGPSGTGESAREEQVSPFDTDTYPSQ